ncbi:S8 family peptidase [Dactylosporangium fulvum]|uniref:S8 family peptidase n=1 Tax=Dactylosporangium fulvum TaxID=53359 RepID=A0ABY5W653_9ACTN|nr:S8 family peptidase [Dactylosporangium fulvum]UWP85552.1 S8 family peptidase [Dactylosporangium fulvum]
MASYGVGRRGVLIELNLSAGVEPDDVFARFREAYRARLPDVRDPERLSARYVRAVLDREQLRRLVGADHAAAPRPPLLPFVVRIWPDYVVEAHVDRSISTVKADAAGRTYAATGSGVAWGVVDSGICRDHPHFAGGTLTDPAVMMLHRDFTYLVRGDPTPSKFDPADALVDPSGHGTHVAAIIAGAAPRASVPHIACQQWTPWGGDQDMVGWTTRELEAHRTLSGIAPLGLLVSLRVLLEDGTTTSSAVIKALDHVREVNAGGSNLRIHGVNLSLGLVYQPREYAAGQSPLCREVNLLVGTGVVAVVSAGNNGAATADPFSGGDPRASLATIADPGNADRAVTVGSTHRDSPHTNGVSFFSSKGPTLDGRPKPDLVAPGERITSAAVAGFRARSRDLAQLSDADPCYIEDSGTSQAAPHVSGAIAAFLSARPEFKGQPDWVKKRFCDSATPLGRHQFFEGAGLLDLMRVLSDI